jgi:replicative DNA helicase
VQSPDDQRPPNPTERAQRWVLGVLLVEPQRWTAVQRDLQPTDFDEGPLRKLAEIYWAHQREEGEPVMSELLGLLGDTALVELAIACVDEVESLQDMQVTLSEALMHLGPVRKAREERKKLIALSKRTNDEAMSTQDEILLFQRLTATKQGADIAGCS